MFTALGHGKVSLSSTLGLKSVYKPHSLPSGQVTFRQEVTYYEVDLSSRSSSHLPTFMEIALHVPLP